MLFCLIAISEERRRTKGRINIVPKEELLRMGILKTASLIKMNKNITPPINPVKAGKFTTKKIFFCI